MRLIDADEALRLFGEEYEETKELIHNGETQLDSLAEGFPEAHHIIKYVLPTVDAVPVVRCVVCQWAKPKNKKFFVLGVRGGERQYMLGMQGQPARADPFLSS